MPIYQVERLLPGADRDSLVALRRAVDAVCRRYASEGKPIRYLESIFTPGESRCRCLFEAPNADLVREANDAAQLPYSRIVMAMALTAHDYTAPHGHDCARHQYTTEQGDNQ